MTAQRGKVIEGEEEGLKLSSQTHSVRHSHEYLGIGLRGRGTAGWAEIRTLRFYFWRFRDLLKGAAERTVFLWVSYSWGEGEGHGCDVA